MTAEQAPAVVQTHVSTLVFLDDRVYKRKRARDLGFVDYRDRRSRETACHEEVRLNRRLSPDVYLGVADVTGVDGRPCDHLVVMRRLPDDRRLSTLATAGSVSDADVDRIARVLADFHSRCPRSPEIDATATRSAIERLWAAELDGVRPYVGPILDTDTQRRTEQQVERFLAGREHLFAARIAGGHIVDGHGDLLADDIFLLPDGPRILDCLEFDARLRYGDVLADIAFLVMDLERLGVPDLGRQLLDAYVRYSGVAQPDALAHHYLAYRAHVRAKVACLNADPGQAAALARLALAHLHRGAVRLVLVGGLPGTGKSTLATRLADTNGWVLRSSDVVRKELAGLPPDRPSPSTESARLYSPERTAATYGELLASARTALQHGESVVLDATWTDARWRSAAREVAAATHAELFELRCAAPDGVADARLRRHRDGPSDATPAVRARLAAVADPWPEATVVRTDGPPAQAAAAVVAAVSGPPAPPADEPRSPARPAPAPPAR